MSIRYLCLGISAFSCGDEYGKASQKEKEANSRRRSIERHSAKEMEAAKKRGIVVPDEIRSPIKWYDWSPVVGLVDLSIKDYRTGEVSRYIDTHYGLKEYCRKSLFVAWQFSSSPAAVILVGYGLAKIFV